jgi:hypothetical protein
MNDDDARLLPLAEYGAAPPVEPDDEPDDDELPPEVDAALVEMLGFNPREFEEKEEEDCGCPECVDAAIKRDGRWMPAR